MKTLNELREAAQALYAQERETLQSINFPKGFLCCHHTHYEHTLISVWQFYLDGKRPKSMELSINKDGLVTVETCGNYPDRAEEFKELLQTWVDGETT